MTHRKSLFLLVFLFAFGFVLSSSPYEIQLVELTERHYDTLFDETPLDYEVYNGKLTLSSLGGDYIDAIESTTYGSVTDGPPSGMGNSNTGTSYDTHLTEESYLHKPYTQLFLKDWSWGGSVGSEFTYSGYDVDSEEISGCIEATGTSGNIQHTAGVDTSSYDGVEFRIRTKGDWDWQDCQLQFIDSSLNTDTIDNDLDDNGDSWGYEIYESYDSQYLHSAFSVRIWYGTFTGDHQNLDQYRIRAFTEDTYYRFQACFRFDDVDYHWDDFILFVEYRTTYAEGYSFNIETGDSTPDYNIIAGQTDDFSIDVSSYITGDTVYLEIYDIATPDTDQDIGYIEQCYLYASNSAPSNDALPTCSNLDDIDHLYAKYREYSILTQVSDVDGYEDIDYIWVEIWDNTQTTSFCQLGYDVGSDTFSEDSDPNDYAILNIGSSSAIVSGDGIDATFMLAINWTFPDLTDIDLRVSVNDTNGLTDSDYYEVDWDIETRLDISSHNLSDSSGTSNRGNIDGSILASGTVTYHESSIHPNTSLIDVYILCSEVSTSPWVATNYDDDSGEFSVTVQADDVVGVDIYSFKAVSEGSESSGSTLLESSTTATYIADQIKCVSLTSPQFIIDSTVMGFMNVELQYAYDSESVVDGTYQLGSRWLKHFGSGNWQANQTPNALTSITYDSITAATINAHGISSVNMSSHSLTMYWEQLVCYIDPPDPNIFDIGENATGIYVYAEYYYHSLHGYQYYNGSLTLNNTIYQYDTIGARGYRVASAAGNDTWGITSIYSTAEISIIWDYPTPPLAWDGELEDQPVEVLEAFRYVLVVTSEEEVDTWWLNDTSIFVIDDFGVITNTTFLPIGIYGLEVSVNDTFGRTLTGSFSVIVQDTTGPVFGSNPTTIMIEFGASLNTQLFAFDYSGISHWDVNDTVHFAITGSGLLFNLTMPGADTYGLAITVYDVYDNSRISYLTLIVNPGAAPEWVEVPIDQVVEYGDDFIYDLDALDDSGIASWSLADTTSFTIYSNGTITSNSILDIGFYYLEISVTDTLGYTQTEAVTVTVLDTTDPIWTVVLSDLQINYGIAVGIQLGASDLSGIDSWTVSTTAPLSINETGYLSSVGIIPAGQYVVIVTASDPYNNSISGSFLLTVEDGGLILGMQPLVLMLIGFGTVTIVIILFLGRNTILGRIRGSPIAIFRLARMEGK